MRSYSRGWPALAAALAVTSCGTEEGSSTALAPADEAVALALYAGGPRTPAGFSTDPVPPGYAQVTTYQVKSSQLATPAATTFELCTDDWSTALAWSEEVAAQANPYLDLVANDTTARYFEFGRVPRGTTDRYVRQRVFRCAYLDRAAVDLAAGAGNAGMLNARPLDAAALRDLAEYLWLFTSYNNAGNAVLATESVLPGPAHVLTLASLERGASCDRVTVREWAHSADAATGALQLSNSVVREFGVRETGGALAAC
ncbi:MAG TPA: hypothetical protein VM692_16015 [Gammaproteobacteria bacterium]|nr:hypothetical protein [Gammaproteobacteria bacterium]